MPDALGYRENLAADLNDLIAGITREERRSDDYLHLTAYENRLSKTAHKFLSSNLSFRQHEGTLDDRACEDVILHGTFMLMGLPGVYKLEHKAREAAQSLFHASLTDFRPTSGLHAMLCTLAATTNPGDIVYTIDPMDGGHAASRPLLARLGRQSKYLPWSKDTLCIDLAAFRTEVGHEQPAAVYLEQGTPLFSLPVREVRNIVGRHTKIIYDASHTLGLISGGVFQDPLREGCDILQGNTHKTFPGPQKAMINFRDREYGLKIADIITQGLVSSQHAHHAIALYITVLEMASFGQEYAAQMLKNAQSLSHALSAAGVNLINRAGQFTESHQLLIKGHNIDERCRQLFDCGISTNARYAFGERVIRIGVQEVTRRGMKHDEMIQIAEFIEAAFRPNAKKSIIKNEVFSFNRKFRNVTYSFDDLF